MMVIIYNYLSDSIFHHCWLDSPYRTPISGAILTLQEKGTLSELKTKWWQERGGGRCKKDESDKEANSIELGLANVGGVFLVLMLGCAASLVIAIFEFLWNIRKVAVEEKVTLPLPSARHSTNPPFFQRLLFGSMIFSRRVSISCERNKNCEKVFSYLGFDRNSRFFESIFRKYLMEVLSVALEDTLRFFKLPRVIPLVLYSLSMYYSFCVCVFFLIILYLLVVVVFFF